jgi:hypothetical protein
MPIRKGQSLLELAAVITLVTLGIFFVGPTVIRGVNAHFKFWDESIQDSYSDPLQKAPPLQNGEMPTNCICSDWQEAVGQRCGVSPCAPTEHLATKVCNPAGCGQATGIAVEKCVDDPQCCNLFVDTPLCGEGVVSQTPRGCLLNYRVQKATCGGSTVRYACRLDTDDIPVDGNPSCVPKCLGTYDQPGVTHPYTPGICLDPPPSGPADDINIATPPPAVWTQTTQGIGIPIKIVGDGLSWCGHPPSPAPDLKCEVYCKPPYFLNKTANNYTKNCPDDDGTPVFCNGTDPRLDCTDTGVGNNHWIELKSPNGCAAWEGPNNYGGGGCQLSCAGPGGSGNACINGMTYFVAPSEDGCAGYPSGGCTCRSSGRAPTVTTITCSQQYCFPVTVTSLNVRSTNGSTGAAAACKIGNPSGSTTNPQAQCTITVW